MHCCDASPVRTRGRVVLVGAGRAMPGLLTLRALRVLSQADVVLHDRLVGDDVLGRVRRDAELHRRRQAGGRPGQRAGHHDSRRASTR